jgi:hypothetical protein
MSATTNVESAPRAAFKINEDWLATLIGLALVVVVGFGLLGPGAQSVALSADPGASAANEARAVGGWGVSLKLDGETVNGVAAPTALSAGRSYVFTCDNGAVSVSESETPPAGVAAPANGRAQLVLVNNCDAPLSLTYSIGALVRWPLFNLF